MKPLLFAIGIGAFAAGFAAGSQEKFDRQGGAGLLGGVDTVQSRTALQQLAFNDRESSVRTAAFRSLGHVGDRTTLQILEAYAVPPAPADTPENAWNARLHKAMVQALEASKERLRKRFP